MPKASSALMKVNKPKNKYLVLVHASKRVLVARPETYEVSPATFEFESFATYSLEVAGRYQYSVQNHCGHLRTTYDCT